MIWKIWKKIGIRYGQYGRKASLIVNRIFHISSHFNLGFFHIFHIISHFNLGFFHIFHIFSLFSSVFSKFSISFQISTYSEKIGKIWKKDKLNSGKIWKIKWWQTFVRNAIIEINNVIMKIKWRAYSFFPYFPVICPFPAILFSLSVSYHLIIFYELALSLVICPFPGRKASRIVIKYEKYGRKES
jgi:hypothetical protein